MLQHSQKNYKTKNTRMYLYHHEGLIGVHYQKYEKRIGRTEQQQRGRRRNSPTLEQIQEIRIRFGAVEQQGKQNGWVGAGEETSYHPKQNGKSHRLWNIQKYRDITHRRRATFQKVAPRKSGKTERVRKRSEALRWAQAGSAELCSWQIEKRWEIVKV